MGAGGRGCGAPCRTGAGADGHEGGAWAEGECAGEEGTEAARTATQVPLTGTGLLVLDFGAKDSRHQQPQCQAPGVAVAAGVAVGPAVSRVPLPDARRARPPAPGLLRPRTRQAVPRAEPTSRGTFSTAGILTKTTAKSKPPHRRGGGSITALPGPYFCTVLPMDAALAGRPKTKDPRSYVFYDGALGGALGPGQPGGGGGWFLTGVRFSGRTPLCTNVRTTLPVAPVCE